MAQFSTTISILSCTTAQSKEAEGRGQRAEHMTKSSFIVAVFMVFLVCRSHLESVAAQVSSAECYDSCSMGCVNQDQRLAARCDRKCRIKCDPAGAKLEEKHLG